MLSENAIAIINNGHNRVGWKMITRELIDRLNKLTDENPNLKCDISHVKEKYCHLEFEGNISKECQELIEFYEDKFQTTCIYCSSDRAIEKEDKNNCFVPICINCYKKGLLNNKIELTLDNSTYDNDFESFKSNYLHHLHKTKPYKFIKEILNNDDIKNLISRKKYLYGNYLYALCVYLIKMNKLEKLKSFLHLNVKDLETIIDEKYVFPPDSYLKALITKNESYLYDAYSESIPEFLKFKIVEVEL